MKRKTHFSRILSTLLVLTLLVGVLPFTMGAGIGEDSDLQFKAVDIEGRAAGEESASGELTLQKVDPSAYDLSGTRQLPTNGVSARNLKASSINTDGSLTDEELTYVEEYAEMLTDPIGVFDVTGAPGDMKHVFVWLQDLPTALEDAYQRHGMHNRNYERVREDGRRARSSIRNSYRNKIEYEYSVIFSGFAIEASMTDLAKIAAMEGVFGITEVTYQQMDYVPDPDYTTLGNAGARELMEIADLHSAGIDGSGIKVGVIDSGIDANHPDLVGALKGGYNFAPKGIKNTAGRSPDLSTPDGNHGTHVSGIIASQGEVMSLGVAPGVDLYMAQVFTPDNTNSAATADIAAALEAFTGGNPNPGTYPNINLPKVDVVNMSLGSNSNTAYQSDFVARNNACIAGVMVVNSAGNNAYPEGNTTDRRNYTLGTGGVSLPISVAASQYGGNPILSYIPTVANNNDYSSTFNFFCENGDSSISGVFRDGSFGSMETRYVTYGPVTAGVFPHPQKTYTIEPLVYIEGKGYELYYACPSNAPTPGGTTGSDMTEAEITALNNMDEGSLSGKILVVNRGQAFYEYKVQALRLGAAGLIVINRDESVIGNLNIGSETSAKDLLIFSAPASFKKIIYDAVSNEQAAYLDPGALLKVPHAAEPADFSSIGPVNETAEIKPDIMAPGWSVLSTDLDGGYTEMGGTSMSSPFVAGVAALVRQVHRDDPTTVVKARIMNTADTEVIKPLSARLNGNPGYYFYKDGTETSVFEQGAGFVNPKRAVLDEAYILVTNYDIPMGSSDKATYDEAQMASFSFGPTMAGSEEEGPNQSKTLTATAYGGFIDSVRVTYNQNTRYSNQNLDNDVVVNIAIAENGESFDAWLDIYYWAGIDQTKGNLYEGYIYVTINGTEYALPWATRVGEFKAPESDYWLVFMDRPVQALRGSSTQDWSPYSSQNTIFFMFEGKEIADKVDLRITSTGQGNNIRYTYYLDFYLISWTPEGSGSISHRLSVGLASNITAAQGGATLKLSDFIDIGEYYNVTWSGTANVYNNGTVANTASNVPAGAYNISVPMNGGNLRYYGMLGFVITSTRPTITIEDYTLTTGTSTTIDVKCGDNEATYNGRLFSEAIERAAYEDFYWAGYYLLNYDEIYELDQSLNCLLDASTGVEIELYNPQYGVETPWFCDADGYFSLTQTLNEDGYFFTDSQSPSGVVYCADAFDVSLCWSGTTVYGWYNYGALASFQWQAMTNKLDHVFDEGVVTLAPKCTDTGILTYTCAECGETKEEVIPALGHDYVGVVTDPTCLDDGYTTYTCSRCNDEYISDEIGALGHAYTGVVTEYPTLGKHGYKTFTCARCGDSYTEEMKVTAAATSAKDFIGIAETSKNSRVWVLSLYVTETYSDGTSRRVKYDVSINANNANVDGKYNFGFFTLTYDIKGNGSNIKALSLIKN